MDALWQHLFDEGLVSLREIIRLLLLSGSFTAVCVMTFPRNAPTRRVLLLSAVTALILLPWILALVDSTWVVTLQQLPPVTLGQTVPNVLLWAWLSVAALLVVQHLAALRREVRSIEGLEREEDSRISAELQRLSADP